MHNRNGIDLHDHLHGAGKLARDFEEEFSAISYTAALLHDLGKASEDFREYLLSAKGHRGSVIHAWQGAFLVDDACALSSEKSAAEQAVQEITREILELAIAKHHGELPDCLDVDGLSTFFDGLATDRKNEIRFSYQEVKDRISYLDLDIAGNYDKSIRDVVLFLWILPAKSVLTRVLFLGFTLKSSKVVNPKDCLERMRDCHDKTS